MTLLAFMNILMNINLKSLSSESLICFIKICFGSFLLFFVQKLFFCFCIFLKYLVWLLCGGKTSISTSLD